MKSRGSETVREEARAWLLRMSSGEATPADEAELQAWLSRSAEHRQCFADVHRLWRELDQLPRSAWGVSQRPLDRSTRWGGLAAAASVAAVLLLGALVWRPWEVPGEPPQTLQYNTRTAELRSVTLEDGTVIELAARTRVAIDYTRDERRLRLQGGEAYFDVAQDAHRPFLVNVGVATISVVGTAFNVHLHEQQATVTVARGEVSVLREKGSTFVEPLSAGQQLQFGNDVWQRLPDRDPEEIATWRQDRKVFRDSPLALVVADLNRYSRVPVVIADAELAQLRVTGSFEKFSDVHAVLETIELSLPARVTRDPDRVYLRARR